MSTLHELIRDHEQDSPEDTAAAVCAAVSLPAKWRDLFFDLLRDECRRNMRQDTRRAEAISAAGGHGSHDPHGSTAPGPEIDRDDYLSHRFYNGDRYVLWGDATVDDHRGRIDFLSKLRNGIDETIERHQEAIDLLVATGARCLNEATTTAVAA